MYARLKTKWEDNLQTCSFGMMNLLCNQYEQELITLDESILQWYNDHKLISNNAKFKKKENDLKVYLERYTLDIIRTKENKFARDTNAHSNGSAYKWTQNTNTRSHRSTSQCNTRNGNDTTNLSPSSSLSSSQSTVYRDLSGDRLPKRRKSNSDTASLESLKNQTGTPAPRRSQPNHLKAAPSRTSSIPHPSSQTSRGPQTLATHTIMSTAPSTAVTAPPLHLNTVTKVSNANTVISPLGTPVTADMKLAPIFFREGPRTSTSPEFDLTPCTPDPISNLSELSIINLSSYILNEHEEQVLKLGLTFCPDFQLDKFHLIKDLHLFARRLLYKVIFDKPKLDTCSNVKISNLQFNMEEQQAYEDLMALWEEGHTDDDVSGCLHLPELSVAGVSFPPPQSYKPKSKNFPLLSTNPNIWAFVTQTSQAIEESNFRPFVSSNLNANQKAAIKSLESNQKIIIKPADKRREFSYHGNIPIYQYVQ